MWQSELRVSWRAQWLSLLLHGVVAAVVLLLPWPLNYLPVWLLLLSLVVLDCVRSQRRINARHGVIKLLENQRVRWQERDWQIQGKPWVIRSGILLRLRDVATARRHYLWIAADSLDQEEWRELRQVLANNDMQTPS
nr:protein YgfX [Shimwellia pseudoproteus]